MTPSRRRNGEQIGPRRPQEGLVAPPRAHWFELEAIPASEGFDQNGHLRRQESLRYRHIPALSFLAPGHFAANLDGVIYEFTA
jgi:hypothetical protein